MFVVAGTFWKRNIFMSASLDTKLNHVPKKKKREAKFIRLDLSGFVGHQGNVYVTQISATFFGASVFCE